MFIDEIFARKHGTYVRTDHGVSTLDRFLARFSDEEIEAAVTEFADLTLREYQDEQDDSWLDAQFEKFLDQMVPYRDSEPMMDEHGNPV